MGQRVLLLLFVCAAGENSFGVATSDLRARGGVCDAARGDSTPATGEGAPLYTVMGAPCFLWHLLRCFRRKAVASARSCRAGPVSRLAGAR